MLGIWVSKTPCAADVVKNCFFRAHVETLASRNAEDVVVGPLVHDHKSMNTSNSHRGDRLCAIGQASSIHIKTSELAPNTQLPHFFVQISFLLGKTLVRDITMATTVSSYHSSSTSQALVRKFVATEEVVFPAWYRFRPSVSRPEIIFCVEARAAVSICPLPPLPTL